ncbi:NEW3 domain-containing protein [Leadbetterella sp. DM7]|uniref:COG1470 family protein n=1 Tax=Leadbetterella sp. DM7 TaxID=3235085 RepID=UPI00349E9763
MLAPLSKFKSILSAGLFVPLFLIFLGASPGVSAAPGSEFTARLMNLESEVKNPFRFSATLHNGAATEQVFEFKAELPAGWMAVFRAEGSQLTALKMEAGKSRDVDIEILASPMTRPGKFTIPVTAASGTETLRLTLEAVVKGNYEVQLSTPDGRLSDEVTEGRSRQLVLTVQNSGTLPLNDLEMTAQSPPQWKAAFEPSKIDRLDPGQTRQVNVTLSVPDKTIAGDYLTTFTVRNNYANANTSFRMTVKTSLLSGWIGLLVILLAVGLVYNLIRKYGRR